MKTCYLNNYFLNILWIFHLKKCRMSDVFKSNMDARISKVLCDWVDYGCQRQHVNINVLLLWHMYRIAIFKKKCFLTWIKCYFRFLQLKMALPCNEVFKTFFHTIFLVKEENECATALKILKVSLYESAF